VRRERSIGHPKEAGVNGKRHGALKGGGVKERGIGPSKGGRHGGKEA
jgi:hypothetical protein